MTSRTNRVINGYEFVKNLSDSKYAKKLNVKIPTEIIFKMFLEYVEIGIYLAYRGLKYKMESVRCFERNNGTFGNVFIAVTKKDYRTKAFDRANKEYFSKHCEVRFPDRKHFNEATETYSLKFFWQTLLRRRFQIYMYGKYRLFLTKLILDGKCNSIAHESLPKISYIRFGRYHRRGYHKKLARPRKRGYKNRSKKDWLARLIPQENSSVNRRKLQSGVTM